MDIKEVMVSVVIKSNLENYRYYFLGKERDIRGNELKEEKE